MNKNRILIEDILSGKEQLMDHFAADGEWIIPGIKAYRGKSEVVDQFLVPLSKLMKSMGHKEITNIVSEGDCVVVESIAKNRLTVNDIPYNNIYCIVYQFRNDKIQKITEYCDTALIKEVFGDTLDPIETEVSSSN